MSDSQDAKPTPEQVKKYVKSGGVKCPLCNSPQIEGDSVEVDAGVCTQDIRCLDCEAEWTDVYSLTDIRIE